MGSVDDAARATVSAANGSTAPTIRIAGELDMSNVPTVEAEIERLRAGLTAVPDFDLGALEFIDSSGIAMFLRLADALGAVRIRHASTAVRLVIDTTGLGDILRVDA